MRARGENPVIYTLDELTEIARALDLISNQDEHAEVNIDSEARRAKVTALEKTRFEIGRLLGERGPARLALAKQFVERYNRRSREDRDCTTLEAFIAFKFNCTHEDAERLIAACQSDQCNAISAATSSEPASSITLDDALRIAQLYAGHLLEVRVSEDPVHLYGFDPASEYLFAVRDPSELRLGGSRYLAVSKRGGVVRDAGWSGE